MLSVQPPHNPYVAPPDFMGRYNPAKLELRPNVPAGPRIVEMARRHLAGYYAMVENWDWNIGRIMSALQEQNLAFRTHVMVFADHGDMLGSHGQFKKMTPHQESIDIPMIISGEQPFYGGRGNGRWPTPVNHVDIAPTTLGLCGVGKPEWMEGTDLSAYRRGGKRPTPDSAYLQSVIPTGHHESVDKPWRGIVTSDGWKYCCFEGVSWLLFNLNEDPYEQANLAHDSKFKPERTKLLTRVRQWAADTGDKFRFPSD